jgi:hypothetical protein
MATYLELVNRVLRRMNEVEIASVASATRGFQAAAKDFVNDAIRDINNAELEWPFNWRQGTQTLTPGELEYSLPAAYSVVDWESFSLEVPNQITNGTFDTNINSWTVSTSGTGTVTHTTDKAGAMRLAAGSAGTATAEQQITLVSGQRYYVETRHFGGALTLRIGISSGAGDLLDTSLELLELDRGTVNRKEFVASGTTAFVRLTHSNNVNVDLEKIIIKEVQLTDQKLIYLPYDKWLADHKEYELKRSLVNLATPIYVTRTQNDKMIIWPNTKYPYVVKYEYWAIPDDLEIDADVPTIPSHYTNVITEQAMYYAHHFREDFEQASIKETKAKKLIDRMRIELINKNDFMQGAGYIS